MNSLESLGCVCVSGCLFEFLARLPVDNVTRDICSHVTTHTCCAGTVRTESDAVGSDYTACFLTMFLAVR